MERGQRGGRLLQARSHLSRSCRLPSPASFPQTSTQRFIPNVSCKSKGMREGGIVFSLGSFSRPMSPFAVVRLSQQNREKLPVAHPEHPSEIWKELFPRTSQALGPPWLAAPLTGAQTWRQQGKPYANMPPEKTCQGKRKRFCAVIFSSTGSPNFVSVLILGGWVFFKHQQIKHFLEKLIS